MKLSALQQHTGLALQAKPTTDPTKSPDTPKLKATGLDAFEKSAPTPPAPAPSQVRSGGGWKLPFVNLTEAGRIMATQEGIRVTAEQLSEGVTSKITGGDSVLNAFVDAFSDHSEDKGARQTALDSVRDLFINFSQDGKFALNTELIKQMKFSAKSLQAEFELDLIKMAKEFLEQEAAKPPAKFTLYTGVNYAKRPKEIEKPSIPTAQQYLQIAGLISLLDNTVQSILKASSIGLDTRESLIEEFTPLADGEHGISFVCSNPLSTDLTILIDQSVNNFLTSKGLVKDVVKDAGYERETNQRG